MEAGELLRQKLLSSLHHYVLVKVLLFTVEGRERFDGSLMVTLRMGASVAVGKFHCLFVTGLHYFKHVSWELFKEEGLKLDEYSLYCIGRGPSLIDLLLVFVQDVKTDTNISKHIWVSHRSEQFNCRGRDWIVLWECKFDMENSSLEYSAFWASEVSVPDVKR